MLLLPPGSWQSGFPLAVSAELASNEGPLPLVCPPSQFHGKLAYPFEPKNGKDEGVGGFEGPFTLSQTEVGSNGQGTLENDGTHFIGQ